MTPTSTSTSTFMSRRRIRALRHRLLEVPVLGRIIARLWAPPVPRSPLDEAVDRDLSGPPPPLSDWVPDGDGRLTRRHADRMRDTRRRR